MRIAGRARHGLTVTQMDATGTGRPRTVVGFTATAIRTMACQVRFAVSSPTEKGGRCTLLHEKVFEIFWDGISPF